MLVKGAPGVDYPKLSYDIVLTGAIYDSDNKKMLEVGKQWQILK